MIEVLPLVPWREEHAENWMIGKWAEIQLGKTWHPGENSCGNP